MLTIAIPTYNRNGELIQTLKSLSNQIDANIKVLIIDNHSLIPVEESIFNSGLNEIIQFEIIRNPVNIGGAANLLRCLELCETEWVWILGDDDLPSNNAVEIIKDSIIKLSDTCFINFCSPSHCRTKSSLNNNLEEFVDSINDWGQINFSSLSVFNCIKIKPHLRFGYLYAYSWSPVICCMLAYLCFNKVGKTFFSSFQILDEITSTSDSTWSPIGPNLGKMTLLDLPIPYKVKKKFAIKLAEKPTLEFSVFEILLLIEKGESINNSLYLYDQLTYRLYYFKSFSLFFRLKFYRLLFYFPNFSLHLVRIAVTKKMGILITPELDRFKRM